jgi:putative transposase
MLARKPYSTDLSDDE